MSREFDKNNTYTTKDVAKMLQPYFPKTKFCGLHSRVSTYFTKCGFVPANLQHQRRTFSGDVCQIVFDHFANKKSKSQITIDDVFECHLHIKGEAAKIIKERSQVFKLTMNVIAEEIILSYDKEHPLNDKEIRKVEIMSMSREELLKSILEKEGLA